MTRRYNRINILVTNMENKQIIFFPYLNMHGVDEIAFGDVKVWNFDRKSEEYMPDVDLREKIKALLASNIMHNKPIKNIGIYQLMK